MSGESQLTVYSSCQKKQNCLRVLEVLSIEGQLLYMNITHTDHLIYYLKKDLTVLYIWINDLEAQISLKFQWEVTACQKKGYHDISRRQKPNQSASERVLTRWKRLRMVPRSKNVGLGKFWPNLEISEAFLMGLEVVFEWVLCLVVSNFFWPTGLGFVVFVFPWGSSGVEFLSVHEWNWDSRLRQ